MLNFLITMEQKLLCVFVVFFFNHHLLIMKHKGIFCFLIFRHITNLSSRMKELQAGY